MAVQHETGRVKTLNRTHIACLGVERVFTIGRQRGGRRHGKGELAVLAVVHEAVLRAVVPVRIAATAGVPIEMPQGAQE